MTCLEASHGVGPADVLRSESSDQPVGQVDGLVGEVGLLLALEFGSRGLLELGRQLAERLLECRDLHLELVQLLHGGVQLVVGRVQRLTLRLHLHATPINTPVSPDTPVIPGT